MPTFTSQPTAATVRRARRRQRSQKYRARPQIQLSHNSFTTRNRTRTRTRQSRYRASFDVEDCFNVTQDQGYHRDSDVHLGSGVRVDVNQFSVLEQDVPCPSNPPRFPATDFTFSYPSPCTPSTPEETSTAAEPLSSVVPTPTGKLLRRRRWPTSSKVDYLTARSSPILPSIPTTPTAKSRVNMPGSFPDLTPCPPPTTQTMVDTGYLDDIKIPSPLLYHQRSRELLQSSSDDDINAELAKSFSLTCGRNMPEPGFESYRPLDDTAVTGKPSTNQHTFGAARLPILKPDMADSAASRNIPHPPWVEQPMHVSTSPMCPQILTTTNTLTLVGSDATIIGPSRSAMHSNSHNQKSLPSTDLVYPRPGMPDRCVESLNKAISSGLWEPSATKPEFIDDDPVIIFRRWTAFENAVRPPKKANVASPTADRSIHVANSNLGEGFGLNGEGVASSITCTTKMAACPTSTCLAVVPAHLYEHQYIGWPGRLDCQPGYTLGNYSILGSALKPTPDSDDVMKLANWVEELGFEGQHMRECPLATDITSSFDEDFKVAAEVESCEVGMVIASDISVLASEPIEGPAVEVDDEGYFTCEDSGSEIGVEEATLSDDEWADWDWEPELHGHNNNEDAANNEDLDMFGIGWRC